MYGETKAAVKKAFEIGKILFSLDPKQYYELLKATSKIRPPTFEELSEAGELSVEDAFIKLIKERYIEAALSVGLTERQGIAMLEYAALIEEMRDEV